MLNFCTLFDSNYILFGLNMYHSLRKNCESFHLYVIAFDDICYDTLVSLNLENLTVISLEEFEDNLLLEVKPTRSKGEYCWTCTPSTVLYCLEHYGLDHCTYVDADLYFYSDPKVLVEEMGDQSVLITSHRYTPKYDQTLRSGKYCVQFITFKNNQFGLKVLNWWREACIDWCYARVEEGKFGDQKYLDNWTKQFEGVHELHHLGGGVAPWNVQQYEVRNSESGLEGYEKKTKEHFKMVFYHFHGLRLLKNNKVDLCEYQLNESIIKVIYKPYLQELENLKNKLRGQHAKLKLDANYQVNWDKRHIYISLKRILNNSFHIYSLNKLLN